MSFKLDIGKIDEIKKLAALNDLARLCQNNSEIMNSIFRRFLEIAKSRSDLVEFGCPDACIEPELRKEYCYKIISFSRNEHIYDSHLIFALNDVVLNLHDYTWAHSLIEEFMDKFDDMLDLWQLSRLAVDNNGLGDKYLCARIIGKAEEKAVSVLDLIYISCWIRQLMPEKLEWAGRILKKAEMPIMKSGDAESRFYFAFEVKNNLDDDEWFRALTKDISDEALAKMLVRRFNDYCKYHQTFAGHLP